MQGRKDFELNLRELAGSMGGFGTLFPLALYYLAVPRSLAQVLGLSHLHAVADEEVSLSVDVADVWERKLAAIHCHRSQVNSSPILSAPEETQRLFLGTEHFRLAADRSSGMGKTFCKAWKGFIHEHSH